jgi:outer membrane translocation and assembly module TamA
MDVVESENERLKIRFKSVSLEHANISREQLTEINEKEKNSFDIRMQLEQILRQAINSQNDLFVTESVRLFFMCKT